MVNKNKTGVTLLLAIVLAIGMVLPAVAEGNETNLSMTEMNESVPVMTLVTLGTDEAAINTSETEETAAVTVDKREMLDAVAKMLTGIKAVNETDWELIFPNPGTWIFAGGEYDISWEYNSSYGIPLKTIAMVLKNGTLHDIVFLAVRQPGFYDGSCGVEIPAELEREEYTIIVVLDYPGMQGTFFQKRMYCDILVFNEKPTDARDMWSMLTNPWLVLTSDKETPMSMQVLPARPMPARPKSSGFV